MENNLFPQELFEETDDLTPSLQDTFSNSLFPEELFEENDLPAAPTVIPPAVSQPLPADALPVEPATPVELPTTMNMFGDYRAVPNDAPLNPFQAALDERARLKAELDTKQQQVDPVQPIPYNPKPLATLVRENAIASQGPTQEYPSVFYPPEPQSLTPAEVETSRLAELFQQAGPLQAKVNANLNPSLSGISGVPGNFTTAQGEVQVPDESAAEIIGKANVTELSNNAVNRGFGRLAKTANILSQQAGIKNTPEFVKKMQELERIYPDAPPEIQAGLKEITDAKGVYNTIMSIASNPSAVLSVVGESLPSSIPALLALPLAGPVAGAGIMGLSSGANEFAAVMDEEIKASGVDINDDAALIELMGNPEFLSKARERGITRGIPIAIFDALSVGIAGRLLSPAIASGSRLKTGAALGGELFGQSALGGLGEFGAQAAEIQRGFKDRYNLGEIGLESVAGIVPGSVETAIQTKSALPQARDNRMRKEFEAELEAAQAEADEQAATDIAIDLLNPNSAMYEPPAQPQSNQEANVDVRPVPNPSDDNPEVAPPAAITPPEPPSAKPVVPEPNPVPEVDSEGPKIQDPDIEAAKRQYLTEQYFDRQRMSDADLPLFKTTRQKILIAEQKPDQPPLLETAEIKMVEVQTAIANGTATEQQIQNEKRLKTLSELYVRTTIEGKPNNLKMAKAALASHLKIPINDTAPAIDQTPIERPEVQSTAPEQPADLSSIPTQIVVGDTAGGIGLTVSDSLGASLRPNDDAESLDVRGTYGGSFTNLQGKKYGTIDDVPYGEPVGKLINNKDGTITIQVGSRIDGKGSGAARDNYVSAAITLPANSTQDQQNAANREVFKNWKSNYEGITSSSQLKANAAKIVPREATPEKPPAIDQTPIERPDVDYGSQPLPNTSPAYVSPSRLKIAQSNPDAGPVIDATVKRINKLAAYINQKGFNVDSIENAPYSANVPNEARVALAEIKSLQGSISTLVKRAIPVQSNHKGARPDKLAETVKSAQDMLQSPALKTGAMDSLPDDYPPVDVDGKLPMALETQDDDVFEKSMEWHNNFNSRVIPKGELREPTEEEISQRQFLMSKNPVQFNAAKMLEFFRPYSLKGTSTKIGEPNAGGQPMILKKRVYDSLLGSKKDGQDAITYLLERGLIKNVAAGTPEYIATEKAVSFKKTPPPAPAAPEPEVSPQAPNDNPVGKDIGKPVVSVQTPDGQASYQVQGKVVELADLKKAEGKLQPRDRSRKDSEVLAKDRAGSKFNADRLLDDPTSGSGAPIIARDGTVMSGNGRVLTMQEVYSNQPKSLEAYKASLSAAGIDTAGFSQPVYVRQLSDDMTFDELKSFADLSNTEAQAQMSMTERASRDAERLVKSKIIDTFRGDYEIGAAQNRPFVTEYAKKILSPTEQGAFVKSDGSISAEGITRVRNALLASAFDNPDTLSIMLESPDDNIKAIGNAFMSTAPKFAQLKKQIADGRTDAQFDITPKLAEMANLISSLRNEGRKPKDFYNQDSMFDAPDPEVKELLRAFYNEELTTPNSKKAMKEFMDFYIDEALQKETGGLIPDNTTATDIIDQGRKRTEEARNAKKGTDQGGLFEASSNVQSDDARGKQAQKRRNAKSSRKSQEVKSTVQDVTNIEEGEVFGSRSQTMRQSLYRSAFAEAGIEPDKVENLSVKEKFNVVSKMVQDKFGFKFIAPPETGAGYNQLNQLLDAYQNLQWMTHSLSMPNTAIGLDGSLGLTLPSKATRYLGAYVYQGMSNAQSDVKPMQGPFVIMPERSNSFAHEWGHALDFHLMSKYGSDEAAGITGVIRATQQAEARPWQDTAPSSVKDAFAGVINAMYFDKAETAAKIMSLEHDIANSEARQANDGKPNKTLETKKAQLQKLLEGSTRSKLSSTNYKETSGEFGATQKPNKEDYYKKPTEMFARAFEAYIGRAVEAAGGQNEFITKGDDAYKMTMDQVKGADERLAMTFPKDEERHNIFLAMDRLMDAMRAESLAVGEPAGKPSDMHTIDAIANFHGELQIEERASLLSLPKKAAQAIIADQRAARRKANAQAEQAKLRPSMFAGDTRLQKRINQWKDTYAFNFINTKRQILFNISNRYKGNDKVRSVMEDIISRVATDPGSLDNRVTFKNGTFEEATRINSRRFAAIFDRINKKHGIDELSVDQLKDLRLILVGDSSATSKASRKVLAMAADLRKQLLNPIYDYMVKNKQEVNYITDSGYMPRMLDSALAINEKAQFLGDLNGDKGAIPLYQQVIYENEYGAFEEGDTDQMAALASLSTSKSLETVKGEEFNGVSLKDLQDIAKEVKAQLKEINNLGKAIENDTGDADIEGLEATIAELTENLNDMHGQLHDGLRDFYATAAGQEWYTRIINRNGTDPSANGVQGTFAKKRSLPPEADKYMNDFYLNPVDAIMEYIPATTRYTEWNARFGNDLVPERKKLKQNGELKNYLEYLLEEAQQAGMKGHEAREVDTIVRMVTGRYGGQDQMFAKGMNTLNTWGTMALLPRAVISSVAEPITAAVQTGSVEKGLQNMVFAFDGLGTSLRGKKAQERKEYYIQLANILGVIDLPQTGDIISNRIGGVSEEDAKNTARLATFFQRTALTGITNAQRRASMRIGIQYIIEQGRQYKHATTPAMKKEAESVLADFGIDLRSMQKFADYVSSLDRNENGFYDIGKIMEASGDLTDMGRMLAVATNRFTDQTIQDPKIVDRPKWAETPIGRMVFGIQSFIAAFQRNVLEMSVKRAVRDFRQSGAKAGAYKTFTKMVLPLSSLYLGHTIVSTARELIFNPDKWEEEKENDNLINYLLGLGLSRSGAFGRLDPWINGFFSLKYQADLSNVLVGASASYYLKAAQRMAGIGSQRNSENTVSSEYQALRGVYDVAVPIFGGYMATLPGIGMAGGYALGFGDMVLTSPKFKHWVLREAIKEVYDEEYYPGSGGRKASSSSGGFGGGGFGSGGFGD